MAVTYSATVLAFYRSAVRNVLVSCKVGESEVVTLVHMLGVCPHEVRFQLRSGITSPSGLALPLTVGPLNASQATIYGGCGALTVQGAVNVDIICERVHSIAQ
jgi:hypothetical protein